MLVEESIFSVGYASSRMYRVSMVRDEQRAILEKAGRLLVRAIDRCRNLYVRIPPRCALSLIYRYRKSRSIVPVEMRFAGMY